LRDDGSDPFNREHNFGLLNQDNSDKPAMKAIRVLTSITRDHTYSGLIHDVPYGAHAVRLDGVNDVVFILWNDDADMRPHFWFSRNELLSVSNMFGEPIVAERDEIVPEETMGPVYVRLRRR
jgi:hypothetical protein